MPANRSCGEAIAGLLESYGVDTVFGIPGVHTLELYKGLANSEIRHILPRHEQGAGFMADGYARASSRPGVCFVISGPGVTNMATPMGQAWSDSVPMLVVSSVNETEHLGQGRGRLHEITDQRAVTAPLAADSALALNPAEIPPFLRQAFASFAAGRPRPWHLSAPLDVLAAIADGEWEPGAMAPARQADRSLVETARNWLESAERPVVLLGGGAIGIAQEAIIGLAESLGAVVVTTTAGKGIFPESHALSLGGTLSLKPVQDLIADADVLLILGSELAETDWWAERMPGLSGRSIRVDIEEKQLSVNHEPDLAVHADAGAFVTALGRAANDLPGDRQLPAIEAARTAIAEQWGPLARKHIAVLDVIRSCLPEDAVIATDMTQIAYTGNCSFPVDRPRCWMHPVGFGTLGYALPAAIGARLGCPDRAVVALAGDYGFQFTLPEIAVAVELELPLPILLWNNDGLGQIHLGMVERDIPPVGVHARNPDFLALARAYDAGAVRAGSLDELHDAMKEAVSAKGPTLIEIREDMPDLADIAL
jgi:5-guanidino-2-oxopentanoate decarboxylase